MNQTSPFTNNNTLNKHNSTNFRYLTTSDQTNSAFAVCLKTKRYVEKYNWSRN